MIFTPKSPEEMWKLAEEATPGLEWFADMDVFLKGEPAGNCLVNAQVTLALCATGTHAGRLASYLANVQPAQIIHDADLIDSLTKEVEGLRRALSLIADGAPGVQVPAWPNTYLGGFNAAHAWVGDIAKRALSTSGRAE